MFRAITIIKNTGSLVFTGTATECYDFASDIYDALGLSTAITAVK